MMMMTDHQVMVSDQVIDLNQAMGADHDRVTMMTKMVTDHAEHEEDKPHSMTMTIPQDTDKMVPAMTDEVMELHVTVTREATGHSTLEWTPNRCETLSIKIHRCTKRCRSTETLMELSTCNVYRLRCDNVSKLNNNKMTTLMTTTYSVMRSTMKETKRCLDILPTRERHDQLSFRTN